MTEWGTLGASENFLLSQKKVIGVREGKLKHKPLSSITLFQSIDKKLTSILVMNKLYSNFWYS